MSNLTIAGAVSAAAPRWSAEDEMAHIEDDIRTGELGKMGKEHPFTMSLTTEEIFYIQTVFSMHKEQLEKRREIFVDGDMLRINQQWLEITETLIEKFEQLNAADLNRLIGATNQ